MLSSAHQRHRDHGFTLVELLVVVAVLAVLVAILIPTLSHAREQAKTLTCSNNMRQMGAMVFQFASMNDGRGPGKNCVRPDNDSDWATILNDEVLGNGRGSYNWNQTSDNPDVRYGISNGHGKVGTMIADPSQKSLSCPKYMTFLPNYNYPFAINQDVFGGSDTTPYPKCGVYGISVNPNQHSYQYQSDPNAPNAFRTYTTYSLGPKLALFRANQFLIIEGEEATVTDVVFGGDLDPLKYTNETGKVRIPGLKVGLPEYCGGAISSSTFMSGRGDASFRHPYKKKGNFLLIDGHVDTLTPKDEILNPRRYGLGRD